MTPYAWTVGSLLVAAAAAVSSVTSAEAAVTNEPHYAVGVAKIDITPSYPVRLNGYGFRRTESEGVTQRIWAKALAIGNDEQKPLVLIAVDSLGLRLSMVEEVARRLGQQAGIERERLAVTFTHSHTTPKVNGACDTIFSSPIPPEHQRNIDRYTEELTDALTEVALAALADRQPARLEWAVGTVGFAKNRRTEGGPVDHDLPMLVVRSANEATIRAIYVTYACHATTLSHNKISGDWAGYAQEAIERRNPGAIALVSIGCGSDANPRKAAGEDIVPAMEQGDEIADEVDRLLEGRLKPIAGKATATLRQIDLPLEKLPSRGELETLAIHDNPTGYNAKYQLARLDRGEPLQSAIDYPIQTWTFGDSLAMVFLAGEVCVDYALRLKQELDATRLWLHGYSNDFCSYIPSERLLGEGGYGGGSEIVYFALPARLAAGVEERIISEVRRQVPSPFRRQEDRPPTSALQPSSPADVLASFKTRDGFVVELMAAEPLVVDPVAIDFGADGRLWVAEMRDYSREVDEQFTPSGRVKVLVDRNGDGRFDHASVFCDGLRFPTDVKVWGQGVIVCDAPDVIYLEDTNGDGRADVQKTLLTGFATHNPQARVNSLRWGLDNWLYGSCGLFGGRIQSFSGQEVELGSRDFRFKPDTGEIEPVSGKTQQGRARDDWGNWFGCENGALVKHYPLSDRYLARNPHVVPPAVEVYVPTGTDPNQLFPIGRPVLFEQSGAPGRPTSVCGLEIYRDELLGREFRGNAFVAEPVNQLVHRGVLAPRGVTFTGERADGESQREFLASTDHWFRPVQIRTGLDGCLWIVDMCRYVIEHPRFIPERTLRGIEPMAGSAAGRVYRVRPERQPPRPVTRLETSDTAGLVAALDTANGPLRDLAQQLLVARRDSAAGPLLEELFRSADRPETRLHAMCALDGLGMLRNEVLLAALSDPDPGVRRHAVRLSEPFLSQFVEVSEAVAALAEDHHPHVQLQLAYTLGEWHDPRAARLLGRLARTHHSDGFLLAAIESSVSCQNAAEVLREVTPDGEIEDLPDRLRRTVVSLATSFGDSARLSELLAAWSRSQEGGLSVLQLESLAELLESLDALQRASLANEPGTAPVLDTIVTAARQAVRTSLADEREAVAAIRILAVLRPDGSDLNESLDLLLSPQSSPVLQAAAIQLLAQAEASQAAGRLMKNWSSYTPALRGHVLEAFFSRDDLLPHLLEGMRTGDVKSAHLNAVQRQRLLAHADERIRAAASAALDGAIDADRKQVIKSYAEVAHLPGDAEHGRELFRKHCASCHRLEGHGHDVGPDLAALTSLTPAHLLESLFDPNRAVDERYQSYVAITDEGRVITGILAGETANSITLIEQQGREHRIPRRSLEELENTGTSLMPEGFEKDLTPADVADLFAYLGAQGDTAGK